MNRRDEIKAVETEIRALARTLVIQTSAGTHATLAQDCGEGPCLLCWLETELEELANRLKREVSR